jgi:EAL domain-containing protein (putative c-di-GMP-specific phosphodiesterase class I)
MPLDTVKLDPSLIADIETDEKARVIVQGHVFAKAMFEEEFLAWTGGSRGGAKSVA